LGNQWASVPLKLKLIAEQSIAVGRPLTVATALENADAWNGKVKYGLGPPALPQATIDAQMGVFRWTPPVDMPLGTYEVIVSARSPEGQSDQQRFHITVTRQLEKFTVDLGRGLDLEMLLIPAGEFIMGSPDSDRDAVDDEKPHHPVSITKPFYLGKYAVTQEQWQAVMGNNPSYFEGPKNPVEQVSWSDCQKFLKRLNAKIGGGKFSLPSEAQWEYACRAGSSTKYCFFNRGDEEAELGHYAWYHRNSGGQTHPVGEKRPNAWGLCDMHGNVWEWCEERWYTYERHAQSSTPDSRGSDRICRGGGWNYFAKYCRSAIRFVFLPGRRLKFLGLRVCRAAEW
jgi:formylglycine-generating enzyme required for sulfatase activity